MRKQRILLVCTFPLRIQKIAFPDLFGTLKSLQNRPRNASWGAQDAPRWPHLAPSVDQLASPEAAGPFQFNPSVDHLTSPEAPFCPSTAVLGRQEPVLDPLAGPRLDMGPFLDRFLDVRTSKIIKKHKENQGFCYFAFFHSGSKQTPFRLLQPAPVFSFSP